MHITLTGNLGSGKSTISRIFEKEYGFEIYSTGRVIREIAAEHGISVLEMNRLMTEDPKYDHMIDNRSAEISETRANDNIFFDSRLAWHFVGKAFRVFLSVSLDTSVSRIMHDNRGNVECYSSPDECKKNLLDRVKEEEKRYKEIYDINYFDFTNYNLVLDSTICTPDVLAQILYDEAKDFYALGAVSGKTKLLISKERGLNDFEKEAKISEPVLRTLCGHEFYEILI